jgi:hypothetical protein
MPVVIFFACLDLEQKSSFMDGHSLAYYRMISKYKQHPFYKKRSSIPLIHKDLEEKLPDSSVNQCPSMTPK